MWDDERARAECLANREREQRALEQPLPAFQVNVLIVKLTSYEGKDTFIKVSPNPLFCVIDAVTGEELDNGYRSEQEAVDAWNDGKHTVLNVKSAY